MDRKRIAIYGGSFDPLTDAHLKVMAEVIHTEKADQVWVVPCGHRSDKKLMSTPLDRLIMTNLAVNTTFGSTFPVYVKDTDIHREATPTYQLMEEFKTNYPDYDFFFVIGSDLIPWLKNWEDGEKLFADVSFLIISRPGYPISEDELPPNFEYLVRPDITISMTKLSSSEIRKRVGMDITLVDGLVPSSVLAYIIRNKLYT